MQEVRVVGSISTGKIDLVQKYHEHDLVFSKPFVLEEFFHDWLISWVQLHTYRDYQVLSESNLRGCPFLQVLGQEDT